LAKELVARFMEEKLKGVATEPPASAPDRTMRLLRLSR
jgi:hypothetical protein